MKDIVLGTTNEGKIAEFREMLAEEASLSLNISGLPEGFRDVPENGTRYFENAYEKASEMAAELDEIVLAEDSGLAVRALNGLPGVWSKRFHHSTFNLKDGTLEKENPDPLSTAAEREHANNEKLLRLLAGVPNLDRTAHYVACLVLVTPSGDLLFYSHKEYEGRIVQEGEQRGTNGFAYDSLFVGHDTDGRTFAELSDKEKNERSHRSQAMREFFSYLRSAPPELQK